MCYETVSYLHPIGNVHIFVWEDGGRGPRLSNASGSWKRQRKCSSLTPLEAVQPCAHRNFRTCNLQNCEIINVCRLKPLLVVTCHHSHRTLARCQESRGRCYGGWGEQGRDLLGSQLQNPAGAGAPQLELPSPSPSLPHPDQEGPGPVGGETGGRADRRQRRMTETVSPSPGRPPEWRRAAPSAF